MLLTLAYRPARFADLVGQDAVRAVLQALVFARDVPPALLFTGASGTGKTSAARILAAALNCADPRNGDCCTVCESCTDIRLGASMSVHEIDAASNGGVEEIRALKALAQFATGGAWRVILLDEAHALSRQAFNALLKMLEEPPPFTVFVLLTTEPDRIAATVRSRAMPIDFRRVPTAAIAARLAAVCTGENLTVTSDVLTEIADTADGSVREAVMLLDQCQRVGLSTVEQVRALTGRTNLPALVVQALVSADHAQAQARLAEFMAASADLSDLVSQMITDLQARFAAHTLSHRTMVAATKLLWDARTIPKSPARAARSQIEALVTLLSAVFAQDRPAVDVPIRQVVTPPPEDGSRRLDLDELADLLSFGAKG